MSYTYRINQVALIPKQLIIFMTVCYFFTLKNVILVNYHMFLGKKRGYA